METTGILIGGAPVAVGDRVVYPNGGICRVKGIETMTIAGQSLAMLVLAREEDGTTIRVNQAKIASIGLRKIAAGDTIEVLFEYLTHSSTDPELDWKIRHRDNIDKMAAGGLLDTAQVLKGLHALARIRPLPQKEREMYDSARHQLSGEIAAAANIPVAVAENNIDYALTPPPGSGREAPKDLPIDIKSLRRSMGGKRPGAGAGAADGDEVGELALEEDAALDSEPAADEEAAGEETAAKEEEADPAPAAPPPPARAKAPPKPAKESAPPKAAAPPLPPPPAKKVEPAKKDEPVKKPAAKAKAKPEPKKAAPKPTPKKAAPKPAPKKKTGGRK